MKQNFLHLIIVFCSITILSCSTPKPIEYREYKNFTIEKLGFSTSKVKMDMVHYNPNKYGLQLKRTDLDVYINNVFVGKTSQEYQITIPAKDVFTIPLMMDVDMKNLFKNSWNVLFKKEVQLKITGTIKVGKANVFIGFPVNYESTQKFAVF